MERQSLKETIRKFFNADLPISGGYGTSIDDAISIDAAGDRGAEVENTVLKYIHAFGGVKYRVVNREILNADGRVYAKVELEVSNDTARHHVYFFDITQLTGK